MNLNKGCWERRKVALKKGERVCCEECSLWITGPAKVEYREVFDYDKPHKEAKSRQYRHADYSCPEEAFPRPWGTEEIITAGTTFGPRCVRCEHMIRGFEHVFERRDTPTTNAFIHTTDAQCADSCKEAKCEKKHPLRATFYEKEAAA